ncbi:MAG: hypothetical protein ACFFCO_02705 [Promethearchaeota archaeon]
MAQTLRRAGHFLASHLVTGVLTVLAMYGVGNVWLVFPATLTDIMMLYSWVLTMLVLPIQAGVQVWSAIRLEPTPFLIFYYFQHDAAHNLPHRFLDPVRSRIGLVTVVTLLIGGLVAWPVYALYGGWLLIARFGLGLFSLENILLFVQAMGIGVSALFVGYLVLASLAILLLQWRRR